MRAASLAALLAAALGSACAGSLGQLEALDSLLPPPLLGSLSTFLLLAGDLCEFRVTPRYMAAEEAGVADTRASASEMYVIQHGAAAGASVRYRVYEAVVRLQKLRPVSLAVYVGGWNCAPGDEASRALVPALLSRHELVLELDLRAMLGGGYPVAAARLPQLARAVAELLLRVVRTGVPPRQVHALGFSLGAHAVVEAARALRRAGGGRLGRLTALDPARPCFTRGAGATRADAEFVEVVHSSVLGLTEPRGHVDVYVREAVALGAAGLAKAHAAAWRVWAGGAGAQRCAVESELRAGRCAGDAVRVGHACSRSTRGIFLVELKQR